MRSAMLQNGILCDEIIRVRELLQDELLLKDGLPEYEAIDGNHRIMMARQLDEPDIEWQVDLIDVRNIPFKPFIQALINEPCYKFLKGK
jgi:hypothetical protein